MRDADRHAHGWPHSYYREVDIPEWADAWNVQRDSGIESAAFDQAYLAAVKREGSLGTGIFGLRLMWESGAGATMRLNRALGADRDIVQGLEAAFGPTLFIHVSRRDKVAQAVSLVRAQQSGLWHLSADGSVLEGDASLRPTAYDRARIAEVVQSLTQDDASWNAFFDDQCIAPLRLVYEDVVAGPNGALRSALSALGLDAAVADQAQVPTAKVGGSESASWIERFRSETAGAL